MNIYQLILEIIKYRNLRGHVRLLVMSGNPNHKILRKICHVQVNLISCISINSSIIFGNPFKITYNKY